MRQRTSNEYRQPELCIHSAQSHGQLWLEAVRSEKPDSRTVKQRSAEHVTMPHV